MHTALKTKQNTVLPWFTRLPWQIKNRVNQNSRYTSHSVDKIIVQKCQKNFYKALYIVLIEIFCTRSKNRVIENRVMENRVKRGITVLQYFSIFCSLCEVY